MNSNEPNHKKKKDGISKAFSIITVIATIIGIITPFFDIIPFFEFLYSHFEEHPFFIGVISSWLSAIAITSIVLYLVNRAKKNKKEKEYNEVFRQSEKWLQGITVVVLFYIAIHLASKALWPIGVPIFGESYADLWSQSYDKLDFLEYISPNDIFLFFLALCIIISTFFITPYIIQNTFTLPICLMPGFRKIGDRCYFSLVHVRVGKVTLFFVLSILFSAIAVLVVFISPSLFDPSPRWFDLDEVPGNDSEAFLGCLVDFPQYNISWAESAEIQKSNDNRTIQISKDNNLAKIMIGEKYLFIWDNIPGNENEALIDFLKQNYGIDWVENANIEKTDENKTIKLSTEKNSVYLKLIDDKMNVSLKIDDGRTRTGEFTTKIENDKQNIYVENMEYAKLTINGKIYDLNIEKKNDNFSSLCLSKDVRSIKDDLILLILIFVISVISFTFFFSKTKEQRKQIKAEFRDLMIFFCFTPAIIVAALAVAGNDLLRFPNTAGHIIVGVLLISGFFTLVTIAMMSFSSEGELYDVLWCLASASLASISGLSVLFSLIVPQGVLEGFGKLLNFAVAIILVVLLYGFFYEKMEKYRFTEWWRREWRPIAIAISIVMIVVVTALDPLWTWTTHELWIIPEMDVPVKLLVIPFVLISMFMLPWFIGLVKFLFRQNKQSIRIWPPKIPLKILLKIPLPKYQGIVLVKVKIRQDSLKKVIKELDSMEGVYQTMVVRGDYDVCLIVEGVDSDDITEKILSIRKIGDDVVGTTTLTDITEFFDREVRYNDTSE